MKATKVSSNILPLVRRESFSHQGTAIVSREDKKGQECNSDKLGDVGSTLAPQAIPKNCVRSIQFAFTQVDVRLKVAH
jgi:hypothetical protein